MRRASATESLLVGEVLRVGKRQHEKLLQLTRKFLIVASRKRGIGHFAGHRVGVVHARCAAKGVARELVEQDDQRERTLRSGLPSREFTARGGLVIPQEALAKARVELRVLGEPQRGTRFAPERDDFLRLRIGLQGYKKRQGEKGGCGIHGFLREER